MLRMRWGHSARQDSGNKWEAKPWKVTCWHFTLQHIAFIHLEFQRARAIAGDKQMHGRKLEDTGKLICINSGWLQRPSRRESAWPSIYAVSAEFISVFPLRTARYLRDSSHLTANQVLSRWSSWTKPYYPPPPTAAFHSIGQRCRNSCGASWPDIQRPFGHFS